MKKSDPRFLVGVSALLIVVFAAVFAPYLSSYLPGKMNITQRLLPPSPLNWLGTDLRGIDVWTSLLFGARISLLVGLSTVCISTVLGGSLGYLAGFYGGWLDLLLMRFIDILMAFPGMILSLTFAALLVPTYSNLVFAIAVTGWIGPARLIRGEVLTLKQREYILAANALGASSFSLFLRHFFPALLPIILTQMTTSVASVILVESGLSFLGLGPRGLVPSWGQLLSEGRTVILEAPVLAIAPGLSIFILIFSINLIGDSLRDRFDPKQKVL